MQQINQSARPSKGITCRNCGSQLFAVIYTRRIAGGRLSRRRQCRKCGRRFTTWESAVG